MTNHHDALGLVLKASAQLETVVLKSEDLPLMDMIDEARFVLYLAVLELKGQPGVGHA